MTSSAELADEISPQEWEWVHEMIGEIERQEKREDFARWFFHWDFAVREFRKVEQRRITLGQPTDADWRFHAICLHDLLATGHALVLHAADFSAVELRQFGVAQEDIEAYVAELEHTFRESHHGFTGAELSSAQQAIFGAAS